VAYAAAKHGVQGIVSDRRPPCEHGSREVLTVHFTDQIVLQRLGVQGRLRQRNRSRLHLD
jgi:hypothetical protein